MKSSPRPYVHIVCLFPVSIHPPCYDMQRNSYVLNFCPSVRRLWMFRHNGNLAFFYKTLSVSKTFENVEILQNVTEFSNMHSLYIYNAESVRYSFVALTDWL